MTQQIIMDMVYIFRDILWVITRSALLHNLEVNLEVISLFSSW